MSSLVFLFIENAHPCHHTIVLLLSLRKRNPTRVECLLQAENRLNKQNCTKTKNTLVLPCLKIVVNHHTGPALQVPFRHASCALFKICLPNFNLFPKNEHQLSLILNSQKFHRSFHDKNSHAFSLHPA